MKPGGESSARLPTLIRGLVAVFVVLIILFRVVGADEKLSAVWNMDEAISACAANSINDGGLPYRDAVDHRGPVTYYLYSFVFKALGRNNMVAIHLALAILVAAIAVLVFTMGRFQGGDTTGLVAMAVFSLLASVGAPAYDLLAFHTEWPALVFTTSAMLLLVRGLRKDRRPALFSSGLLFGCAFLSKQVAICDMGAALVFCALSGLWKGAAWKRAIGSLALLMSGAAVPVLLTICWFALRGALPDFVFYFWVYNTEYYMAPVTPAMQIKALAGLWRHFLEFKLAAVLLFALAGIGVGGVKLVQFLRNGTHKGPDAIVLFTGWAITSWVGASLSTRGFGHYYIAVLAPLGLLAGAAICGAWGIAGKRLTGAAPIADAARQTQSTVLRASLATLVVGLAVIYSVLLAAVRFEPRGGGWGESYRSVSRYIADNSTPEDTIFVWGFAPEIYTLSNRPHASRFVYTNPVTGLIPWLNRGDPDTSEMSVPGSFDLMMEDLSVSRPRFIIDTSIGDLWGYGNYPISKYPELAELIHGSYREVGIDIDDQGQPRLRLLRRTD